MENRNVFNLVSKKKFVRDTLFRFKCCSASTPEPIYIVLMSDLEFNVEFFTLNPDFEMF